MMNSLAFEAIQFLTTQIPDIEVVYKQVQGENVPMWPSTLKHYLQCDKDYSDELKSVLDKEAYNGVSKVITDVVRSYVTNGEMTGPNNFRIMKVERDLIKNRVTAMIYTAYQDGVDITEGLRTTIQKYSSPYCMLLKPNEERAVCAAYRVCQMGKENDNGVNYDKEAIYSIAYTFFCLRIRKCYSVYEKALKAADYIEDGLIAAMAGFANTLNEYDFTTSLDTGMGPGRLNIPIIAEIKKVLRDANTFSMSEATLKKIYAYDEDKHGHLTREELMQEFHASSATVNLMLSYDQKDMSGISAIEFEECNTLSFASEDDGFFEIELRSVLDRVLDDDERMVFELVVNEGMKYKDVATKMGLTERKIKYLFDLCRKKLRPIYSENYEQYEKGKKKKK